MSELCVCGAEKRLPCPKCGKFVRIVKGKLASHEVVYCGGSHLEYKTCPGSNQPCHS